MRKSTMYKISKVTRKQAKKQNLQYKQKEFSKVFLFT